MPWRKRRQPIINNVFSKCYCNHSIDQEDILRHIATLFAWKAQSHSVPPPILTKQGWLANNHRTQRCWRKHRENGIWWALSSSFTGVISYLVNGIGYFGEASHYNLLSEYNFIPNSKVRSQVIKLIYPQTQLTIRVCLPSPIMFVTVT